MVFHLARAMTVSRAQGHTSAVMQRLMAHYSPERTEIKKIMAEHHLRVAVYGHTSTGGVFDEVELSHVEGTAKIARLAHRAVKSSADAKWDNVTSRHRKAQEAGTTTRRLASPGAHPRGADRRAPAEGVASGRGVAAANAIATTYRDVENQGSWAPKSATGGRVVKENRITSQGRMDVLARQANQTLGKAAPSIAAVEAYRSLAQAIEVDLHDHHQGKPGYGRHTDPYIGHTTLPQGVVNKMLTAQHRAQGTTQTGAVKVSMYLPVHRRKGKPEKGNAGVKVISESPVSLGKVGSYVGGDRPYYLADVKQDAQGNVVEATLVDYSLANKHVHKENQRKKHNHHGA